MKRVISMLLAAALVLALLPSFAFAADEAAESYVYNFKTGLHSSSDYITRCTDWTSTDSEEGEWVCVTYNHTGAGTNAGKHNTSYFSFRPKVSSADVMPTYSPGIALDTSTQFMSAITLKIEVKKDGIYTPSVSLATEDSSPKWEVFLTKVEESVNSASHSAWVGRLDSSNRLGTIDGYGSGEDVSRTFLNRELEAGSYYLTFVTNGKNDLCEFTNEAAGVYRVELLFKSFALKNVEDVDSELSYNTTSSALKDPTTASSYNMPEGYDKGGITGIAYSVLNDTENKFSVAGTRYCQNAKITDKGLQFDLLVNRYAEYADNGYFTQDEGGNWIAGSNNGTPYTKIYGHSTHLALKLNIPYAGDYKLYLLNPETDLGAVSNVFFVTAPASFYYANNDGYLNTSGAYKLPNRHDSRTAHVDASKEYIGEISVPTPGDYYLLFAPNGECFEESGKEKNASGFQILSVSGIKLEQIVEEDAEILAEQQKFDEIEKTKTNAIASAVASGLSNTATVNILTTEINGDEAFEETAKQVAGTPGEQITVEADKKEGYEFLYWAKGMGANRKAVSENAKYTFKATSGGTWLTAVYKDTASEQTSVVFYNGNGEEISRSLVDADSEITMPSLPTLRGHEASIGWALGDANTLYQPDDTVTASGSQMLFVAQFNDPAADTITVKVNGKEYDKFAYGEKVTVTATERENGSGAKVFVYWKKDGEIVSFDKTYSFLADEDCELTPCYEDYKPITEALRKIIIKASGNNLMAEFIGVDTAVEKGIIFGGESFGTATQKIAMKQSGNQLSAVNDEAKAYVGYAIFSDGTVIYDK